MVKSIKAYNKLRRDIKKQGFNPKDFLTKKGNIVYCHSRFAPAIYLGESIRIGLPYPHTEGTYVFEFKN